MIDKSKITHISEWRKISELPSSNNVQRSLDSQYGSTGIYQVADGEDIELIGDDLVSPHIGYIGKSSNIHDRTYKIRQTANSKTNSNSHGAGTYIRQNLNPDSCFVRVLYCSEENTTFMENLFHNEMQKHFGYKFKWKEASGGKDGEYVNATILVDRLSNEERKNLIIYAQEAIKNDLFADYMNA